MGTAGRGAAAALVVAWSAVAASCGGGGGGGGAPPSPTISGTIRASASAVADGDTNDATREKVPNNTFAQAQAIPSAATVGGWASATRDVQDVYRAQLAAGQTITLEISDWNGGAVDLDLCIFSVTDTANPVDCLVGVRARESLTVAADGEYFVGVEAALGASNYLLRIGQPVSAGVGAADSDTLALSADFVPGELVVRFRSSGPRAAAAAGELHARAASVGLVARAGVAGSAMLLELGGESQRAAAFRALALDRGAGLDFGGGAPSAIAAAKLDTLRVVKALRRRADVESADPNYLRRAYRVPNDPLYQYQWHFPLIRLPQAWDVTNPGTAAPELADVVVAIADSGVMLAHPDLAPKLLPGYDFVSNVTDANDGDGPDPNADDPGDSITPGGSSWHGTHVAGIVAARSDDGVGVAGVAWGARILPVRVLGRGGSGTSFDVIQGIRWAAGLSNSSGTIPPRRADVVNLSLGGPSSSATELAEFRAVRDAGVLVVAAAGNENTSQLSYPASYEGVISVSAVDIALARAPYSNSGSGIDLAAPGGDSAADRDGNGLPDGVVSTYVDDSTGTREPAAEQLQGTSMAAPHVAGVVALMKTVCPTLTPADFDSLLAGGAITRDLGVAGRDDTFGYGLVDAAAAVQAASTTCGTAPAPFITVDPPRLDLGATTPAAPLQVSVRGEGLLGVTSVTADVPWLTVSRASVDANGIGTYVIGVNRTGLANGRLAARLTVTPSAGAPITVPVTLQVGSSAGAGDVGRLYVLLVDAELTPVAQAVADPSNGAYAYSFPDVAPGTYFVIAGSDADDDGQICDAGEACGAYPTLGDPGEVRVSEARAGVDFSVAFESDLTGASAAAASGAGIDARSVPRMAPRKSWGSW